MTVPQPTAASWPDHFTAYRAGHSCPMCTNDWQADDIGWGLLLHRGEVAQSYPWRSVVI
ncbi:hypothetical protein ACFVYE_36255 [Streptomyces sp. NPDC058239]|uniref:hypothetical protein n=1 Tax=Streptomyces sp. NPDC058239 TaxID=3346395 RepID=UPI0036E35698